MVSKFDIIGGVLTILGLLLVLVGETRKKRERESSEESTSYAPDEEYSKSGVTYLMKHDFEELKKEESVKEMLDEISPTIQNL